MWNMYKCGTHKVALPLYIVENTLPLSSGNKEQGDDPFCSAVPSAMFRGGAFIIFLSFEEMINDE